MNKIKHWFVSLSRKQKRYGLLAVLVSLVLVYLYTSSVLSNKKMVALLRPEVAASKPSGVNLVSYREVVGLTGEIHAKYKLNQSAKPHRIGQSYCEYFVGQLGWYESPFSRQKCTDLMPSQKKYHLIFCYGRNSSLRMNLVQVKDTDYELLVTVISRGGPSGGC